MFIERVVKILYVSETRDVHVALAFFKSLKNISVCRFGVREGTVDTPFAVLFIFLRFFFRFYRFETLSALSALSLSPNWLSKMDDDDDD